MCAQCWPLPSGPATTTEFAQFSQDSHNLGLQTYREHLMDTTIRTKDRLQRLTDSFPSVIPLPRANGELAVATGLCLHLNGPVCGILS